MTFDGQAFGREIVAAVKAHVTDVLAPVTARIDALEKRLDSLPVPRDGKDADEDAVFARVMDRVTGELDGLRSAIDAIEPAPEVPDVAAMIDDAVKGVEVRLSEQADWFEGCMDEVSRKIASIPEPKDGRDGKDGESVTVEDVLPILERRVDEFLAAIPLPKDGAPGPKGEKGDKGDPGKDGRDGIDGRDGADGVGVAGAVINRDGELVITLSDGTTRDLGRVVGKDGAPGRDGADGVGMAGVAIDRDGELVVTLSDGTARKLGPVVGKDGAPGRDGADGVGFDDMACEVWDDGVYLVWRRGDVVKDCRLPVPIDMGVWKADTEYKAGHCVTWAGSVWIAQKDAPEGKPDAGGDGWRLAVKRGRDGKDRVA